jgi:hydrogenase maturation protease
MVNHSKQVDADNQPRILILGYGNVDRGDDGLGYYVVSELARRAAQIEVEPYDDLPTALTGNVHLLFLRQLTPELAETLAEYERVCFVDAHTGNVPDDLNIVDLESGFQTSPFTHHMTPATCLALAHSVYGRAPQARLVSVRGHEFGFSRALSPRTAELAEQAVEKIMDWVTVFTIKRER